MKPVRMWILAVFWVASLGARSAGADNLENVVRELDRNFNRPERLAEVIQPPASEEVHRWSNRGLAEAHQMAKQVAEQVAQKVAATPALRHWYGWSNTFHSGAEPHPNRAQVVIPGMPENIWGHFFFDKQGEGGLKKISVTVAYPDGVITHVFSGKRIRLISSEAAVGRSRSDRDPNRSITFGPRGQFLKATHTQQLFTGKPIERSYQGPIHRAISVTHLPGQKAWVNTMSARHYTFSQLDGGKVRTQVRTRGEGSTSHDVRRSGEKWQRVNGPPPLRYGGGIIR